MESGYFSRFIWPSREVEPFCLTPLNATGHYCLSACCRWQERNCQAARKWADELGGGGDHCFSQFFFSPLVFWFCPSSRPFSTENSVYHPVSCFLQCHLSEVLRWWKVLHWFLLLSLFLCRFHSPPMSPLSIRLSWSLRPFLCLTHSLSPSLSLW